MTTQQHDTPQITDQELDAAINCRRAYTYSDARFGWTGGADFAERTQGLRFEENGTNRPRLGRDGRAIT